MTKTIRLVSLRSPFQDPPYQTADYDPATRELTYVSGPKAGRSDAHPELHEQDFSAWSAVELKARMAEISAYAEAHQDELAEEAFSETDLGSIDAEQEMAEIVGDIEQFLALATERATVGWPADLRELVSANLGITGKLLNAVTGLLLIAEPEPPSL